jgi:hypothetical protein
MTPPTALTAQCTGGAGARILLDQSGNCATCGFPPSTVRAGTAHCFLYEHCDRCQSETMPCAASQLIREDCVGPVGSA